MSALRLAIPLLLAATVSSSAGLAIHHTGPDLQATVDAAPPHATILCDRAERLTISRTIVVNKPLTIRGLYAALPDSLGKTPILRVQGKGFTLLDFELHGNAPTVDQKDRSPLLVIETGDFRVERGKFVDDSKDGVEVNTVRDGGDIVGGTLRDLVGIRVVRDVVSISGSGRRDGLKVRNLLVDNIRGYNSSLRGVVEVSDGAENITVRKVFADSCVYAIDVQDHNKPSQINRNIVIEDVYARDSRHAIRMQNHPFGHTGLTIRDIVAERCERPLEIRNTHRLSLSNVRILDHTSPEDPALKIEGCDEVVVRDVAIVRGEGDAGILVENTGDLRIDGVSIGKGAAYQTGVDYTHPQEGTFTYLSIRNVVAPSMPTGIRLTRSAASADEGTGQSGTLSYVTITDNTATIVNDIKAPYTRIADNQTP